MVYLLIAVFCSSIIYVIFKSFRKFEVNTFQAIIVNYLVCLLIGFSLSGYSSFTNLYVHVKPALPYAIVLGIIFILLFNIIALTAQKFGVSITSIADRTNLVIPVMFAFLFYDDKVSGLKVLGIALAVVAIVLAVSKSNTKKDDALRPFWYYPLIVFVGGGTFAILLKVVQHDFDDLNFSAFLVLTFGIAFFLGIIVFLVQIFRGEFQFQLKNVIGGVALGIPNYFSLYLLLEALDTPNWESSLIFPITNVGVLVLSTILGIFIFKEKLTKKNWLGVALSVLAISLLIIETIYG